MLCMNCQQDTQDVGGFGTDALQKGTYDVHRQSCSPAANHTLPNDIQAAVCNKNIRIDDFIYGGWDDGTWFYVFSMETAEKEHAANNNNTFTHCTDQISGPSSNLASTTVIPGPTTIFSPSSPAASGEQSKPESNAFLIGGVVGGVLFLVIVAAVAAVWKHRKRRSQGLWGRRAQHLDHEDTITPSLAGAPIHISDRLGSEGGSATRAPDIWSSSPSPLSRFSQILTEPSLRHHDAGPLLFMPPLARSNESGLLPPAYDETWDREYAGRIPPRASSVSTQTPHSADSEVPEARSIINGAPPFSARRSSIREFSGGTRALPIPIPRGTEGFGNADRRDVSASRPRRLPWQKLGQCQISP